MIIPRMLFLISLHSLFFGVVVASDSDDTSIFSLFETVAALAKQEGSNLTFIKAQSNYLGRNNNDYSTMVACENKTTGESAKHFTITPTWILYRSCRDEPDRYIGNENTLCHLLKKMIREELNRRALMPNKPAAASASQD